MDRELIYSTLYSLFGRLPGVQTSSRKLLHWADVTEFPAFFQAQKTEVATKLGRGVPTKWMLLVDLYVYVRVEPGKPSSPALNKMLDAVVNAIAAPQKIDNKQTLGGIVEDCWIDGQIITDEGTLGELAVAIIPVHIEVTQPE
jgi:hypothetical protein